MFGRRGASREGGEDVKAAAGLSFLQRQLLLGPSPLAQVLSQRARAPEVRIDLPVRHVAGSLEQFNHHGALAELRCRHIDHAPVEHDEAVVAAVRMAHGEKGRVSGR
jgi:hypothetical protein